MKTVNVKIVLRPYDIETRNKIKKLTDIEMNSNETITYIDTMTKNNCFVGDMMIDSQDLFKEFKYDGLVKEIFNFCAVPDCDVDDKVKAQVISNCSGEVIYLDFGTFLIRSVEFIEN